MGRFVSYVSSKDDGEKPDYQPLVPCKNNLDDLNMEITSEKIKNGIEYGSCINPEQSKVKGNEMQGLE